MSDSHSTVSSQSIFGRLKDAFVGIFIGILLFLIAFPVLFLNEGRALKTAKGLEEGASAVVSIEPDKINKAMDKKLVHLNGNATTVEEVNDPEFNITVNAIALRRVSEMYQWKEDSKSETRDKLGGGQETITTYTYKKTWASNAIDSSKFDNPTGHTNPGSLPFDDKISRANLVTVGKYKLPTSLIQKMDDFQPLKLSKKIHADMPDDIKAKSSISGQFLYIGKNPDTPKIGDTRISFQTVDPGPVSIIARQTGNSFEPYTTKTKTKLLFLYNGTHSAEEMFESELAANVFLTWMLRLLGVGLMFGGLMLVFRPIAVMASIVPFIGKVFSMGSALIAGAISIPLSLMTIAVGWLFYRPLIGILLFLVAGGIIVGVVMLLRANAKKKQLA